MTTDKGGATSEIANWEMLSAAHTLFSSDRIANEQEIVIATCVDVLARGPQSTSVLHEKVKSLWPGAQISLDQLESAINYAVESGVIATQSSLGSEAWALTSDGLAEVEATKSWFSDVFDRFSAQIYERAVEDMGGISRSKANGWADKLVKLFLMGISQEESSYRGDVEEVGTGNIRPIAFNGSAIMDSIENLTSTEEVKDFLKACVIAAVDEMDSFGNEIVNYVCTSCVLHAVIAGRSRANARELLGSLKNQRVVIDTPLLFAYMGPRNTKDPLERVVLSALAAGMEVIVPNHVLDELNDVVDRIGSQVVPGLMRALAAGTKASIYASVVNERVLELFLEACEERRYRNWEEFTKRAMGLGKELAALGVIVRDHENAIRTYVEECEKELRVEMEMYSHANHRGDKQILRDAESMELVWRSRRRSNREVGIMWPGGWLISTDRRIDPAFSRVDLADPNPLIMTPAQWATLIVESDSSPGVLDLVRAATKYVRQETTLRISVKYPPKIALELASSLSDDYISHTDLRVAQMNLGTFLDQTVAHETTSGEKISTRITKKRSNRILAAAQRQREATSDDRARMTLVQSKITEKLGEVVLARESIESEKSTLAAENLKLREQIARDDRLGRRRTSSAVVLTLLLVVTVLFFNYGHMLLGFGTFCAALVFLWKAREWVTKPERNSLSLLYALVPELIPLIYTFSSLAGWIKPSK